ncbi:MAG: hypothetical protein R3324_15570, partial [Halobacteriales archaeon]|nr:hypothetical protein [Halobacteriales archaeon]
MKDLIIRAIEIIERERPGHRPQRAFGIRSLVTVDDESDLGCFSGCQADDRFIDLDPRNVRIDEPRQRTISHIREPHGRCDLVLIRRGCDVDPIRFRNGLGITRRFRDDH